MSLLQSFLQRVERFVERHKISATRFGRLAANDPNFVFDLRRGRKPNPDLIEAVDRWMREYRAEKNARPKPRAEARVA